MQFYEVNKVKVDFITYPYAWLRASEVVDGVRLAHIEDRYCGHETRSHNQ